MARLVPLLFAVVGATNLWFTLRWNDRFYRWQVKGIHTPKK